MNGENVNHIHMPVTSTCPAFHLPHINLSNHVIQEALHDAGNQVPNHGFQEGSGAGSERQVPGRFRAGSESRVPAASERQVPGQVPNHGFREVPGLRTTVSRKVPGQVPKVALTAELLATF